ncbi:MAG: hypothetical protein IJE68_02085 [Clostridia bacterium]|nr:hypothetical protein [Clostridia bacterium]
MVHVENKPLQKLEDAVQKCKRKGIACLWHTDGLAIQFNGKIPENSVVGSTLVFVSGNDSCLIMLVCVSTTQAKSTIVPAGKFSSLGHLKSCHPQLFEKMGSLDVL